LDLSLETECEGGVVGRVDAPVVDYPMVTIPCNPLGSNGTFNYSNNKASGKANAGSFTLKSLSSVSCINSLTSKAQPGDYDTVQFAGYGSWSADGNPHLVNAQISTSPNYPIVHIMIDAGTTSIADTKPADNPPPPRRFRRTILKGCFSRRFAARAWEGRRYEGPRRFGR
jgi:hypothetical protein